MSDGGECRPAVIEGDEACFSEGCEAADEAVKWPSVEFEAMRVSGDGRWVGWTKRDFFCESLSISSVEACRLMSVKASGARE